MIFLLSQIVLALLLAAVLGGALGWLLHRTTQVREAGQLRNAIQRQRQQIAQLNSEIAMLTDDYDELQRQSHDELVDLREANQQIPRLNSNLEKSQLLVSQMLKRNESQVRDLNAQNQTLSRKLEALEGREQQLKRQEADLDSARREMGIADSLPQGGGDAPAGEPSAPVDAQADTQANTLLDTPPDKQAEPPAEVQLELQADALAEGPARMEADVSDDADSTPDADADADADNHAAAPVAVADDTDPAKTTITNTRNTGSWASAPLTVDTPLPADHTPGHSSAIFLNADKPLDDDEPATAQSRNSGGSQNNNQNNSQNSTPANSRSQNRSQDSGTDSKPVGKTGNDLDSEPDPFDLVVEVDDELLQELDSESDDDFLNSLGQDLDDSPEASSSGSSSGSSRANQAANPVVSPTGDSGVGQGVDQDSEPEANLADEEASSFDPVERQDDLQQIFGIGPLTEKALNDMGITSYAQLAKLKHHEIETIANALQIVPGRIERDDWVGNARRQLEDVLEEL